MARNHGFSKEPFSCGAPPTEVGGFLRRRVKPARPIKPEQRKRMNPRPTTGSIFNITQLSPTNGRRPKRTGVRSVSCSVMKSAIKGEYA
jgi:hypothetical protein